MKMYLYRIIDANINRASEGLRVVEELARFVLGQAHLAKRIKQLRHTLRHAVNGFPLKQTEFLTYRDTEGDVGTTLTVSTEEERQNYSNVLLANMKRVQEATRVLEEYGKILNAETAQIFKKIRYETYTLEKEILAYFNHKLDSFALYVITGEEFARGRPITQVVSEAIAGGAQAIQLREKKWSGKKLIEVGKEIRKITADNNVLFIVNDRVDIAMALNADGVHLGQDDMPYQMARSFLGPEKIIGVSTHSYEQALEAQNMGADYIGVGPVFNTGTKKNLSPLVGLELVKRVSQEIKIPFVAIGGINNDNISSVIESGAPGVAVISAVIGADDVMGAARELKEIIGNLRREINEET